MIERAQVLLVAATPRELPPGDEGPSLCCGVGPVEAAARTAAALAVQRPAAVLHIGIAGAQAGSGLVPPTLVIGRGARYVDAAAASHWVPRALAPDPRLLAALTAAYPQAPTVLIGTSARVGGPREDDVAVEAMEGFAVLSAAALAGVPAIEVRTIANAVEERDRSRWQIEAALTALHAATPALRLTLARALADA